MKKAVLVLIILLFLNQAALAELNSTIVLYDNLLLSDVVCSFEQSADKYNERSLGTLWFSMNVNGPANVAGVRIASWQDTLPSKQDAKSSAEMMTKVWQKKESSIYKQTIPFDSQTGRPLFSDELNKSQYILMVGLDTSVNLVGYSVIKVDIPSDLGSAEKFVLPSGLRIIETEAFKGVPVQQVVIPSGATYAKDAFDSGVTVVRK